MAGLDAFGTILRRGNGATPTEVFAALANITNISGPGHSRETLDVSAHDSPNQYRQFLGGIKDAGEVSLDVNYDPGVHDILLDDLDDEDPRNYEIEYPDGTVHAFAAILTGFESTAPFDDKLSATITFKVNGKPEVTPAT